jgi:hypothetical protein
VTGALARLIITHRREVAAPHGCLFENYLAQDLLGVGWACPPNGRRAVITHEMSGNLGLRTPSRTKYDCRTGKRISTSCRQNRRGLRHIEFKEDRHLMFEMTAQG